MARRIAGIRAAYSVGVSRSRLLLGIGGVLLAAMVVRIVLLAVPGHRGDVSIMAGWAERIAEVGPWRFYEGSGSIYPALLYPLWALGAAFDGEALQGAIKALSIPFDIGVGLMLFFAIRAVSGERGALTVAALYLFNPGVLLAGPAWGQVDAAGTLPWIAALAASAAGRHGPAAALAVLAGLVKPQFGLALLPVVAVAAIRSRELRSWRPLMSAALGGCAAYVLVAAPLALHPGRYLGLLVNTAAFQPYTSLNAFNPWGLLVGFEVPDDPYVGAGTALLVGGLAASLLPLRRGRDLGALLAAGALLALAFYFLPTRVHERYLFPAMALLAPFALLDRARLAAYVALSLGFAASLVYALHTTTQLELPEPLADAIVSPVGVWAIGLVLIGSAVAWTWMLLIDQRSRLSQLTRPPP
jgi:hypothetical protein